MNKTVIASILAIGGAALGGHAFAGDTDTGSGMPSSQPYTSTPSSSSSSSSYSSSAGQYTSAEDSATTARVQDRLSQDRGLKASGISVETIDGKIQLNGFANSQAEKNAAGALARSAAQGKEVSNNVLIYEQGE